MILNYKGISHVLFAKTIWQKMCVCLFFTLMMDYVVAYPAYLWQSTQISTTQNKSKYTHSRKMHSYGAGLATQPFANKTITSYKRNNTSVYTNSSISNIRYRSTWTTQGTKAIPYGNYTQNHQNLNQPITLGSPASSPLTMSVYSRITTDQLKFGYEADMEAYDEIHRNKFYTSTAPTQPGFEDWLIDFLDSKGIDYDDFVRGETTIDYDELLTWWKSGGYGSFQNPNIFNEFWEWIRKDNPVAGVPIADAWWLLLILAITYAYCKRKQSVSTAQPPITNSQS